MILFASASRLILLAACAAPLVAMQPALAAPNADATTMSSLAGTYLAARTADADKDMARAADFYRKGYAGDSDNLFLLERALVLTAASGDVPAALPLANYLLAKAPESRAAHLILAVERIRDKEFADAAAKLKEAGTGVLADITNGLLLAWTQFGMGEFDRALDTIEAISGEDWYEPFKLLHSGYVSLASGRTDAALEAFTKAYEQDNNAIRIIQAYASTLSIAGRRDEAEKVLTEYLERFPDNALARVDLAAIQAGADTRPAVGTAALGAAEALAGIGAAIGQEGGLEVSALYLQLAMHLEPRIGGGLAALSLGNLLDSNGQSEAAIAAFQSIDAEAPFRGLAVLRAAVALDRLDRTDEAEKAFKEAIERNPDDVQALIAYGNMLRGRERFTEAAELYTRALDKIGTPNRGDWTLLYFRGIAYERTKDWAKAEADFKKALELYPDQPLVLNYLGYSWVDMGMNLEQALDMIRKAVELRPTDGYIVDSLGWAYYRLGRYEDAVTELERAVSLRPDDPVINDHLGDAYWRTGRTLEAQFQWRHARDFGAKPPELDLILKKIAAGRLLEDSAPVKEKAASAEGLNGEAKAPSEL